MSGQFNNSKFFIMDAHHSLSQFFLRKGGLKIKGAGQAGRWLSSIYILSQESRMIKISLGAFMSHQLTSGKVLADESMAAAVVVVTVSKKQVSGT
jgi:hypothetical protein